MGWWRRRTGRVGQSSLARSCAAHETGQVFSMMYSINYTAISTSDLLLARSSRLRSGREVRIVPGITAVPRSRGQRDLAIKINSLEVISTSELYYHMHPTTANSYKR